MNKKFLVIKSSLLMIMVLSSSSIGSSIAFAQVTDNSSNEKTQTVLPSSPNSFPSFEQLLDSTNQTVNNPVTEIDLSKLKNNAVQSLRDRYGNATLLAFVFGKETSDLPPDAVKPLALQYKQGTGLVSGTLDQLLSISHSNGVKKLVLPHIKDLNAQVQDPYALHNSRYVLSTHNNTNPSSRLVPSFKISKEIGNNFDHVGNKYYHNFILSDKRQAVDLLVTKDFYYNVPNWLHFIQPSLSNAITLNGTHTKPSSLQIKYGHPTQYSMRITNVTSLNGTVVNHQYHVITFANVNEINKLERMPQVLAINDIDTNIKTLEATESDLTGATIFHKNGLSGNGIGIAIIDNYFDTYGNVGGYVENGMYYEKCGTGCKIINDTHGSQVASIVRDIAPGATLYLFPISELLGSPDNGAQLMVNAVNAAESLGVKVITTSLSPGLSAGGTQPKISGNDPRGYFRDGTSIVAKAFDDAASKGIVTVAAAGNDGDKHFRTTYNPMSTNGLSLPGTYFSVHNFGILSQTSACLPVTVGGITHDDQIGVTWDDWSDNQYGRYFDYDIFLMDSNMQYVIGNSQRSQFINYPYEIIYGDNLNANHFHPGDTLCLVVAEGGSIRNTGTPLTFDIHVDNNMKLSHTTASYSLGTPADSLSTIATGAIDVRTNAEETYTSQGPIEGTSVQKPDVCAYDDLTLTGPGSVNTTTHRLIRFNGTSFAAPQMAGAAALLFSQDPTRTVSTVKNLLYNNADPHSDPNLTCGAGVLDVTKLTSSKPPLTPFITSASLLSSTSVALSWLPPLSNGGSSITGYSVSYGTSPNQLSNTISTASTSATIQGLSSSTTYIQVSAVNNIGTGTPTSQISVSSGSTRHISPPPPANLVAIAGDQQVTLYSDPPSTTIPTSLYKIYQGLTSGTESLVGGSTPTPSLYQTVSNLQNYQPYYYEATASNQNAESARSFEVTATPKFTPPFDSNAPLSLSANQLFATTRAVELSWIAPSTATGEYEIYRSTTPGQTGSVYQDVYASSTGGTVTWIDYNVQPSTTYYYYVQSVFSGNNSGFSNEAPVTVISDMIPDIPTNLQVTPVSSSQVNLSWTMGYTGGPILSGFELDRSTDGINWSALAQTSTTSYSDTGLTPNTIYYYRVSAFNTIGTSSTSNSAYATTLAGCSPPASGDWTITSDCTLTSSTTAPANVVVQPNIVLTIPNGITLTVHFNQYHLLVQPSGKVMVNPGGKISS